MNEPNPVLDNMRNDIRKKEEELESLKAKIEKGKLIIETVEILDKHIAKYRGAVITVGGAAVATACAELRALLLAPDPY